jgi:hypothetical protein
MSGSETTTAYAPASETDSVTLDQSVDLSARSGCGSPSSQVRTAAQQEYALSLRNRWALALTALFAALSVLVVGLTGAYSTESEARTSADRRPYTRVSPTRR